MAVTYTNIHLDFSQCPDCESDFDMLVEVLHHTMDNIDGTLKSWGFQFSRRKNRIIEIRMACGGLCFFTWRQGLANIGRWNC